MRQNRAMDRIGILLVSLILLPFVFQVDGQLGDLFTTDPDKNTLMHDYIASRGFNWQFYSVPLRDGWFIGLYRIVNPLRPVTKQPILLASASGGYSKEMLRSAAGGYVTEPLNVVGPNLGFEIAKRGYDVWLLDWRGNFLDAYQHVRYTLSDIEYYDYSFDEYALFDLPTAIDFVRGLTGRKTIGYVCLEDAATPYFMLASMVPRFNFNIKPFIALSPMWSLYNETNPSPLQKAANKLFMRATIAARGNFYPEILWYNIFVSTCNLRISQRLFCNPLLYFILKITFTDGRVGSNHYDRLVTYLPADIFDQTSWMIAQQYNWSYHRQVSMLDVNPVVNMDRYGGPPLEYMPERITNPDMYFFTGKTQSANTIASISDTLLKRLGTKLKGYIQVPADVEWSSLSYLDGRPEDEVKYVNTPVLKILEKYK